MDKVLYVDILFATDFACDVFSLYITGRLCRLPQKGFRSALGAVFGATASTAVTAMNLSRPMSILSGIPISFFMCLISFGKCGVYSAVRRTALLWSSASLIFGFASALSSFLPGAAANENRLATAVSVSVSAPLILFVSRLMREAFPKRSAVVEVSINGKTLRTACLVDSGNVLCDPFSGDPVIIISSVPASKIFSHGDILYFTEGTGETPDRLSQRLRLIPAKTVGGEILLRSFRPDQLKVDGVSRRALVAVIASPHDSFGSFDGVVPSCLAPAEAGRKSKKTDNATAERRGEKTASKGDDTFEATLFRR